MKTKKKYSKTLIAIYLVIAAILLFFLITTIIKEVDYRNKYNNVKENAVNYIRNKYGFDAEIVEVTKKDSFQWEDSNEYVDVKMQYNNKDFWVFADKVKGSSNCVDGYQFEEIQQAAKEYVNKKFPDGDVTYLSWIDPNHRLPFLCVTDTYFDGSNIEEILKSGKASVKIVFTNRSFTEADLEILPDCFYNTELISFDTNESKNEFLNKRDVNGDLLKKYAPHISDYLKKYDEEITEFDINLFETEDFFYLCFPSNTEFHKPEYIELNEIDSGTIKSLFAEYKDESWLNKTISKEYSKSSCQWIYYPVEKLKENNIETIGAAWYSFSGSVWYSNPNYSTSAHGIEPAKIYGDYAVFNLPFYSDYFTIVDITGRENDTLNYEIATDKSSK